MKTIALLFALIVSGFAVGGSTPLEAMGPKEPHQCRCKSQQCRGHFVHVNFNCGTCASWQCLDGPAGACAIEDHHCQ